MIYVYIAVVSLLLGFGLGSVYGQKLERAAIAEEKALAASAKAEAQKVKDKAKSVRKAF